MTKPLSYNATDFKLFKQVPQDLSLRDSPESKLVFPFLNLTFRDLGQGMELGLGLRLVYQLYVLVVVIKILFYNPWSPHLALSPLDSDSAEFPI